MATVSSYLQALPTSLLTYLPTQHSNNNYPTFKIKINPINPPLYSIQMISNTTLCVESQDYKRLQAEFKFLRMEKDLAVKMWKHGSQELESAILQAHSLRSVLAKLQKRKNTIRRKVDVTEKDTLSIQITNLQEMLQKLRRKSELREMEVKEVFCSNTCQAAIENVAGQLKAESEQLWQMQWFLGVLYKQVQELHNSRDLWQNKAIRATTQAAALKEKVQEWRHKGRSSRRKLCLLQSEITHLRNHPHIQSNTLLYHEKRNKSDKRDKIDHPFCENCCCWTDEEESNSNIKRREMNRVMPKRQPLLDEERKLRVENIVNASQISKTSECSKKNNGVTVSKGRNTRQDPHCRNQGRTRCPLQNISNVIVYSPPPPN